MKKHITLMFALMFVVGTSVLAQDPLKRPDNIGVGDFDSFKNTSFDAHDESLKLNTDTKKIDGEIKGYAGLLSTISIPKLKGDLDALRGISKSQKNLREKLASLEDQGKSLLGSAKNVTPRLKAPAATGITNKSIKALEGTRKNLDGISGLLAENSKLLMGELKARGEAVEVFD